MVHKPKIDRSQLAKKIATVVVMLSRFRLKKLQIPSDRFESENFHKWNSVLGRSIKNVTYSSTPDKI